MLQHNPTRAAKMLGLELAGVTDASVRAAFAAAVREAHPDAGNAGRYTLAQLREAKAALLAYLDARR